MKKENFCKCGKFNYTETEEKIKFPRGVIVEFSKSSQTFKIKCKCGEEVLIKTK